MMRTSGLALAVLLMTGGCQGGSPDSSATAAPSDTALEAAPAPPPASETPSEAAADAGVETGRSVQVSNDLYEFAFSYPDAAGAISRLKDYLDTRLAASRSELAASAAEERKMAESEGYPYHPHAYDAAWATVTDLPGWLSLSATIYTFSGGAHGMSNFDSLLWDRRAEAIRRPRDLFTSTDALRRAIREPFCNALDQERAVRRGEPVKRDSEQMFSECIDPMAQTLILGSANGQTFDRIGILVAPYEAGPYAEGSYEVTLPVTGRVMATLKPQYRSSFAIGR